MVVYSIQEITAWLPSISYGHDLVSQLLWKLPVDWTMLAQTVTDPDVLGRIQRAFNHFVQTGQVWAMLIGVVIGYMLRSLTSYG